MANQYPPRTGGDYDTTRGTTRTGDYDTTRTTTRTTGDYDTPRSAGDYDAPHTSPVTPSEDARTVLLNKVSWGAIFAGIVAALVTQLILNMLGIGLGFASIDPGAGTANNPDADTASIVAAAWWAVSGIIAAFIGGLAAGRLSGKPKGSTTGWHGFIAWAGTTLIVIYLVTSTASSLLGGTFNAVSNALGGLAGTASQVASDVVPEAANPFAAIEQQVRSATGGNDPQQLRDAAVSAVRAAVTGDAAEQQQATDRAAEALARAQNISVEDARAQVQQYVQEYQQTVQRAQQEATQAAAAATDIASRGALIATVALVIGALAGWLGGRAGAVAPTVTGGRRVY